jgi:HK97 family phage portal protein
MNIFQRIGSYIQGGLRRLWGYQKGEPPSYDSEPAATVTFDTAMQLSAVWACVKLVSETVASLPVSVYKTTQNGREIDENHDLTVLFSGKVNRYQTKVEFFETVLLNLLVYGNAYCQIQKFGDKIVGLLPLMSSQMEVQLMQDGSLTYEYYHDTGVQVYAEQSIWHLKLFGNGIVGLSPIAHQRNTLGIAIAAEKAVTNIYRNGAKPSGVLTLDKWLTPEQRDQVRQKFYSLSGGNQDRLMVLEGGMKFDAISLSPQDIELLASRQFQISEICRWYGVPSVMINDTSSTTVWGSGIAQIVEGFYKVTLRPILEKIEASMQVHLNKTRNREIEFDFNALTRGDLKARYEAYRIGIHGGFLMPDEARQQEGLPKAEGGDKLYIQGATVPLTDAGLEGNANGNANQTISA